MEDIIVGNFILSLIKYGGGKYWRAKALPYSIVEKLNRDYEGKTIRIPRDVYSLPRKVNDIGIECAEDCFMEVGKGLKASIDLDIRGIDFSIMFGAGTAFSNIKGSHITHVKLSSVPTSCASMFSGSDIGAIDLSEVDLSKVESFMGMFYNCYKLRNVILPSVELDRVKSTENMFGNCRSLKVIDLSSLEMENLEYVTNMFSWCTLLEKVILPKGEYRRLKGADSMFLECENLTAVLVEGGSVEGSKHFDADNHSEYGFGIHGTADMFNECSKLQVTDLRFLGRMSPERYKADFKYTLGKIVIVNETKGISAICGKRANIITEPINKEQLLSMVKRMEFMGNTGSKLGEMIVITNYVG